VVLKKTITTIAGAPTHSTGLVYTQKYKDLFLKKTRALAAVSPNTNSDTSSATIGAHVPRT
jgi:hypothetical protein